MGLDDYLFRYFFVWLDKDNLLLSVLFEPKAPQI